jgi:eukaryotic-like serine/threonine-protein kinase
LWKRLDECPDLNQHNVVDYFGIAHGWAGLLYATLLWSDTSKRNLPVNFMKRVEELQHSAILNDDSLRWTVSGSDKSFLTGWCNGSAGHIFLWSLLYQHFKVEKYLRIAMQAANHIILHAENNISNLCCGYAGEAYSFLNLYYLTKEKKYLDEAKKCEQKIMNQISLPPLRSNSLYKGDIGLAVLLSETGKPEFAQMPLFEIRKI